MKNITLLKNSLDLTPQPQRAVVAELCDEIDRIRAVIRAALETDGIPAEVRKALIAEVAEVDPPANYQAGLDSSFSAASPC